MIHWVWILILVLVLLLCAFVLIIFNIKYNLETRKVDIPRNAPMIDMQCMNQFTDGYTKGLVKFQRRNKNKTWYFEVFPTDGDQREGAPLPNIQKFIVAEERIDRYSKGEYSSRREEIKILPRTKLDMPKKMRNTLEGEYFSKAGAKSLFAELVGTETENTLEAIRSLYKGKASGEFTKDQVEEMLEQKKHISKLAQVPYQPPESKTEEKR